MGGTHCPSSEKDASTDAEKALRLDCLCGWKTDSLSLLIIESTNSIEVRQMLKALLRSVLTGPGKRQQVQSKREFGQVK
jgi:hypothetical protein